MTAPVSGEKKYFIGVDVGAVTTKAVLIDEDNNILAKSIIKSGADFSAAAEEVQKNVLEETNIERNSIKYVVSTGYGRNNVKFRDGIKTEISCHSRGAYYYFPGRITIIDIGGQDNKIIKLDKSGKKTSFKMNRKCAAGTGTFLEEIANRLDIPLDKINSLAKASKKIVDIGSYCTVFSSTEILSKIKDGEKVEDLIRGAFRSVVKRLLEMEALDGPVVMTGGVVEHNPFIADTLKEFCDVEVKIPENPQAIGAFGAALYAREQFLETNKEPNSTK
jgi:predicted CoA-substrate-specific enzyme activase